MRQYRLTSEAGRIKVQRLMKYEPLALWVLLVILGISTLSTAVAAQQAAKAAKNTDLIAQCTTPGTKCFQLQQVGEARRSAQNKCVIDTIANLPLPADRQKLRNQILNGYDACVEAMSKQILTTPTTLPVIDPSTSTSTTEKP